MRAARQRWALSFADLCLLLLGFFVVLQARPDGAQLAAGLRGALGTRALPSAEADADALFQPGEALLNAKGRAFAAAFAGRAGSSAITVDSRGTTRATDRFDAWELAAARTAALARALAANGVPAGNVTLALGAADMPGQRLRLIAR